MDYINLISNLVSYCQRNDILSSDSAVIGELAEICGISREEAEEIIE